MTTLEWDQVGEKLYETGIDRGVLFLPNNVGDYDSGFAWNGLTSVEESPSGAESNKQYANNKIYVNLTSAEEYSATLGAFTFPDEFSECDGTAQPVAGLYIGQQRRKTFGLSYRSLIGNDLVDTAYGYKLHLVYGGKAAPSSKTHSTVNESPEAMEFSWEISTIPVDVPGHQPTSTITIDSTRISSAKLAELEALLYGTVGQDPRLPSPAEVIALLEDTTVEVRATEPSFDSGTDTITIPVVTGVDYKVNNVVVAAGPLVITEDTVVTASPQQGYKFPAVSDNDWYYDFV
jgi:hypothetical protein